MNRSRSIGALVAAPVALLALAAPAGAATEDSTDDGVYTPYPPVEQDEPSLNATAVAECLADAAWISYDVVMAGPESAEPSSAVTLVFTQGGQRLEVPLGDLGADGTLSGSVLWPGTEVDDSGTGVDWPGWEQVDGEWTDVGDADLGWTRTADVSIEVNPASPVAVTYPPATPTCNAGPPARPGQTPTSNGDGDEAEDAMLTLPETGAGIPTAPAAATAAFLAALGGGLLLARRRRS